MLQIGALDPLIVSLMGAHFNEKLQRFAQKRSYKNLHISRVVSLDFLALQKRNSTFTTDHGRRAPK